MKVAIFALAVVAVFGPGMISTIAYKLRWPWTSPQIATVGAAVRWAAICAIVILIGAELMGL